MRLIVTSERNAALRYLMSLMWGGWVYSDLIQLHVGLKKLIVQTNANNNNRIIMGCCYILNDSIFSIGLVQIQRIGRLR